MKQELLDRLRKNNKPVIIGGAGIVGGAVFELCRNLGIRVEGFCDGSIKLTGTEFHSFRVIHTSRLKEVFPEVLVLITAAAIKDVVDSLREQGIIDWIAAGPLLEDHDINQQDFELDDRKFAIETCIICHAGYLLPDRAFLRSIDLIITERCSLKCKDCANLMQYYERPRNVDFGLLMHSIDVLCDTLDEIMEMRIIGGDALMNKQWPDIVARTLTEPKIKRVVIYTNGSILPTAEQAQVLRHPKVLMVITDYGVLSRNLDGLKAYLADHGIAHRILQIDSWLDCASLEKHNRSTQENVQIYKECCAKNMLSFSDGKLFRCPFAANADRLDAVPGNATDYVDVLGNTSAGINVATVRNQIMNYVLHKGTLETCDYCNGRPLSGCEVPPAIQTVAPLPYKKHSSESPPASI